MSDNQEAHSSPPPAPSASTSQNTDDQRGQLVGRQAANGNPETSVGSNPRPAQGETETNEQDHKDGAVPAEDENADILDLCPRALRMELLALRFANIAAGDDDKQAISVNARTIAIQARLRQLGPEENTNVQLTNEDTLQSECCRLMGMAQGDDDGQDWTVEDVDAINRRANEVNERLTELRPSSDRNGDNVPDVSLMDLYDLDEEEDRLVEEYAKRETEDPAHQDLAGIRRRYREVKARQADLIRFPPDSNEEVLGEEHIQNIMLSGGNLPRFLFRGSNARSGGNDSESEPSSSDDDLSDKGQTQTVRMVNGQDRVVPHAHFADPQMMNHPKRHTIDALRDAAEYHTSARRFNTPFTSWTCDFETAVYFAIGHFPNDREATELEDEGQPADWVFHNLDMPAEITVVDTWTIPDRHLRIFHQPALVQDSDEAGIPSEFLIYGALDRADGVDLRSVPVHDVRAQLHCPSWPRCASRTPAAPHEPTLQDVSEAWTIARAFLHEDGGAAAQWEDIDLGLVVLAGELARQQWAGFPPRPEVHELEAFVQIQWPEAWMKLIRECLERITPEPLGARMSGIPLANAGTPYVGFPQFRLMQQLLLSWVMDYPSEPVGDDGEVGAVVPAMHDCGGPALLASLSEFELARCWRQMVRRDRDGNIPVPLPREFNPDRSDSSQCSEERPLEDVAAGGVPEENRLVEDAPTENMPAEATDPNVEATAQQQAEGDQRLLPEHPQDAEVEVELGLRGGGYPRWGEEAPVNFWNALKVLMIFLLAPFYMSFVMDVY